MLTPKQKELLLFIHERLKEAGVPPSYDEMKDALDLRSKSGIHRLITALEERGFIRRLPHRARALEIIKLPEGSHSATRRSPGFSPSVIEGSGRRGFSEDVRVQLKRAYRIFFHSQLNVSQAIERARDELPGSPELETFLTFVEESERGILV